VSYDKVRSVWFILLIFYIVRPYKKLSKVMYFPLLVLPSVSSVNRWTVFFFLLNSVCAIFTQMDRKISVISHIDP